MITGEGRNQPAYSDNMGALADFLFARFDEEVAGAGRAGPAAAARLLVDTTVKRELVERWLDAEAYGPGDPSMLKLLAWAYEAHPDFRPEWRHGVNGGGPA
jgi:hypothetical protein